MFSKVRTPFKEIPEWKLPEGRELSWTLKPYILATFILGRHSGDHPSVVDFLGVVMFFGKLLDWKTFCMSSTRTRRSAKVRTPFKEFQEWKTPDLRLLSLEDFYPW